jgi:Na+-driven multidrug efflux pump
MSIGEYFAAAVKAAREGVPIALSALVRVGMTAVIIAWIASISPEAAGNFSIASAAFASIASIGMGFSILAQVRFANIGGIRSEAQILSSLVGAALLVGVTLTVATLIASQVFQGLSPAGSRGMEIATIVSRLAFSYPTTFASIVLSMYLIATGRKSWILYASLISASLLIAAVLAHRVLAISIDAKGVANLLVTLSFITLCIYAYVARRALQLVDITVCRRAMDGSRNFVLWPSLEQFTILGLMMLWQTLAARLSSDIFNIVAIALGLFGLYRALVRGVSQLTAIDVKAHIENKDGTYVMAAIKISMGAGLLSCLPILMLGTVLSEQLRIVIGWDVSAEIYSQIFAVMAVSFLLDAIWSIFVNSLQVLGRARFIFLMDASLAAIVAVGFTWAAMIFGVGNKFIAIFCLLAYHTFSLLIGVTVFVNEIAARSLQNKANPGLGP